MAYDAKILNMDDPLDPEYFFDIDPFLQRSDIIVNLVDNESFKRKLDYCIYRTSALLYFNAGINLYNGQCYVSYPRLTNLYTIDHPAFIEDNEEVSVHSCADADAEGTDDNPEQMFNGNDLAASILANLYQTAITQTLTHRKIKFTCGLNISISKELPTLASLPFSVSLKYSTSNPSYPYEEAEEFIQLHGSKLTTPEAKEHYFVKSSIDTYLSIVDQLQKSIYKEPTSA